MEDLQPIPWVDFEDEVFKRIKRKMREHALFVDPNCANVYRKRKYFSPTRNSEIEFEVAIEAFSKGATEPSFIWLFECKDKRSSGRKVEASEVEALADKILQLGRSRVMASMVTTHGFQSGALGVAQSNGISLFVLNKRLERVTKYARDVKSELVEKVVLDFGVTATGRELPENEWFEHALSACLMEFLNPPSATADSQQESE